MVPNFYKICCIQRHDSSHSAWPPYFFVLKKNQGLWVCYVFIFFFLYKVWQISYFLPSGHEKCVPTLLPLLKSLPVPVPEISPGQIQCVLWQKPTGELWVYPKNQEYRQGAGGLKHPQILGSCYYVYKQLLKKNIQNLENKRGQNSFQVISSVTHTKIKA